MEHRLVIFSLHDLKAACSCGRWEMTAPTRSDESRAVVHARASEQHALHVRNEERSKSAATTRSL